MRYAQPQSGPLSTTIPLRVLFNAATYGQQATVPLTTTTAWNKVATPHGIGMQGGSVSSATSPFIDSAGVGNLQAACSTLHITFVVLSNGATEGIASIAPTAVDGAPRWLLQNAAGTLQLYDEAYTNMEPAVIGKRYVFSIVYSDISPYVTSYYLNGRLITSKSSYRQGATWRLWLGSGYPAASVNSAILLCTGRAGVAESAAEVAAYAANPWTVLKSAQRVLPVAAVVGGAAALAGTATASATATGALSTGIPLSGSANATATASGALTTAVSLSGSASAQATATGAITTGIALSGAATCAATATAALSTSIRLAGSASSTATATGALTAPGAGMSGSATSSAAASGALTTSIALAGNATASATASGALTAPGAGLSGSASCSAAASGALTTAIRLGGSASATAAATGVLTTGIALVSTAGANVFASGALTTAIRLSGNANCAASATGSLAGAVIVAPYVSPARTVYFGGSTNRASFDGGTNRVDFDGGPNRVNF